MDKTIVLVTDQIECERIIKSAKIVADLTGTQLCVLSVVNPIKQLNPQALEHLFKISKQFKATMTVTYSNQPVKTIIKFIRFNKTHNVLSGLPSADDSVLYKIWQKFTHINFFTVAENGNIQNVVNKFAYTNFEHSM